MTTIIALFLFLIFLFLSSIHIYWCFGGKWAGGSVIPTKEDNKVIKMPGVVPTLIVAIGLLGFGLLELMSVIKFDIQFPTWFMSIDKYGLRVIASIFIVRAIGEFKYVGFFKRIKHTKFGINDTKYYSPLCLMIGLLTIVLEIYK